MADATNPLAPQPLQLQVVQPPQEVMRVENQGPQTVTREAHPEASSALDELKRRQEEELAAQKRLAEEKQKQAELEAKAAEDEAARARAVEEERGRLRGEYDKAIQSRMAEAERRRSDMEAKAKPTDYWEDKGSAARVMSAFMVGLNVAAGGDQAYKVLQDEMTRDRQKKIDAYTKSREYYELARTNPSLAEQALGAKLKAIDESEQVREKVLLKQATAIAKRSAIPQAAAEAEKFSANLAAKQAQDRAKEWQHYDRQVTSGRQTVTQTVNSGGAPTGKESPEVVYRGKRYVAASPEEGKELRGRVTNMDAARATVERIATLATEKGRLPDTTLKTELQQEINNLLELKKDITGAQTEGDRKYFADLFTPGLLKSPESVRRGLDAFVSGMDRSIEAGLKAKATPAPSGNTGGSPPATPAPAARPSRREIISDADRLRAWLKSDEAKRDPERAKAVREALQDMRREVSRDR